MTQERRNLKTEILKKNCGSCCHNNVCKHKGAFESALSRVVHEAQPDDYLVLVDAKCKFHMYLGGTTFRFDDPTEKGGDA